MQDDQYTMPFGTLTRTSLESTTTATPLPSPTTVSGYQLQQQQIKLAIIFGIIGSALAAAAMVLGYLQLRKQSRDQRASTGQSGEVLE